MDTNTNLTALVFVAFLGSNAMIQVWSISIWLPGWLESLEPIRILEIGTKPSPEMEGGQSGWVYD